MKPILFNTEMVRAILDGRKTVTRRIVKGDLEGLYAGKCLLGAGMFSKETSQRVIEPPYEVNDILYVRETWTHGGCAICEKYECYGSCGAAPYLYKADFNSADLDSFKGDGYGWRPSIHMPKEAARIFLKVTGLRVERLQEITNEQILLEGVDKERIERTLRQAPEPVDKWERVAYALEWAELWNSTVKDKNQEWNANPYVWVIEFEVIDKAAALKEGQA